MTGTGETSESKGTVLCKSCGLCCTGHLFVWAKLRSVELHSAQALGLNVFGSDPRQRGFSQPCPLWDGECTIYTSPHYPHFCRTYKCKLLKAVLDENTPLPNALTVVQQTKATITELEALLPISQSINFRVRFVEHLQHLEASAELGDADLEFRRKAHELLTSYKNNFGVKDVVDNFEEVWIT